MGGDEEEEDLMVYGGWRVNDNCVVCASEAGKYNNNNQYESRFSIVAIGVLNTLICIVRVMHKCGVSSDMD